MKSVYSVQHKVYTFIVGNVIILNILWNKFFKEYVCESKTYCGLLSLVFARNIEIESINILV